MTKVRTTLAAVVIIMIGSLVLAACSPPSASGQSGNRPAAARTGPIRPTWINPETGGDSVALPVRDIQNSAMTHFKVRMTNSEETFMAYELEGKIYVRADICPPCRSESFSLDDDTLVCDTCRTVFDARTGAGIAGACVAYPKASVSYQINDGRLIMKRADLISAYQNTLKPKKL